MGPSMTHRFESYLVRMKFSILLPGCQCLCVWVYAWARRRGIGADSRIGGDMSGCKLGLPISIA